MAKTNTKPRAYAGKTHEGARSRREDPIAALERVLNAHMLWEDTFYIDGKTNADVLDAAVEKAIAHDGPGTWDVIVRARTIHNIRHASLKAAVSFAKAGGPGARSLITAVVQRADEMAEVLAMAGAKKAPHAVMKGVRDAFAKFDEYQFGKYKGEKNAITLRDAVFLSHPSPKDNPLIQKIVDQTLATPETWEVGLSAGGDKRIVFETLLGENKLGAMALLRNLRNMRDAGVNPKLVKEALEAANWRRVLPFRFLSAAKNAPGFEKALDVAFASAVSHSDPLPGSTAVLVDTSGSMGGIISAKSTVRLVEAGAALAAAINGDQVDLYEWADRTERVPNWQSLSTALSIRTGKVGHGTNVGQALAYANAQGDYDRIIVVGDMQFNDRTIPALKAGQRGYTINLAPYENMGLMQGKWMNLTGFSAATLKFIASTERG